ncbi:hypothetical protein [Streptomyces sp. NPDC001292]|uniref:hypothetical protein n=1 Tax=Streptomyces sp. NPDC001292 TaxID=3364558 RepID=UPI0036A1B557
MKLTGPGGVRGRGTRHRGGCGIRTDATGPEVDGGIGGGPGPVRRVLDVIVGLVVVPWGVVIALVSVPRSRAETVAGPGFLVSDGSGSGPDRQMRAAVRGAMHGARQMGENQQGKPQ